MDQLTRLSPEDAERTLIRVVQECQEWGDIAEGMAIPAEKKFIDRQYARAIAALAEIVKAGSDGDPLVEKAQKTLETNHRADEQHRNDAAEQVRPEVDAWVAEHLGSG